MMFWMLLKDKKFGCKYRRKLTLRKAFRFDKLHDCGKNPVHPQLTFSTSPYSTAQNTSSAN